MSPSIWVAGDFPNPLNGKRIATQGQRAKASAEHRAQKEAVFAQMLERFGYRARPALPVTVRITRFSNGTMDVGGLYAALKWAEDAIASFFGVDDSDPRFEMVPLQRHHTQRGIAIEVVPMLPERFEERLAQWHARRKKRRELPDQQPVPSIGVVLAGKRRGAERTSKTRTSAPARRKVA